MKSPKKLEGMVFLHWDSVLPMTPWEVKQAAVSDFEVAEEQWEVCGSCVAGVLSLIAQQ